MSRPRPPIAWVNLTFLAVTHGTALIATPLYLWLHGPSWAALAIAAALGVASGLSITGGYHRLFAHASYQAHPIVRLFYLVFGAAAFQNSALKWSADHRRHHRKVDTERDPYNIREGFWWAHVGWVLRREDPAVVATPVPDLERDPLVRWQHRRYMTIGVAAGFVLPTALGAAFGDAWGGLVLGGFARICLLHHATFSINSFAHTIGTQPYSDRDSSRDSFVTALISLGEGYHNFHHTFPGDYRNGVRAYHFDPTKWVIRGLAAVGLTHGLRRVPDARIAAARIGMQHRRVASRLAAHPAVAERLAAFRRGMDERLARWHAVAERYELARREARAHARERLDALRAEARAAREEFRAGYAEWKRLLRAPDRALG